MFYDKFLELCNKRGVSPSRAATEAGINKASVTYWKKKWEKGLDTDPDQEIIDKFCAYFSCDEAWLRGIGEPEKTPTLTAKDERDIARDVERIMNNLEDSGELMFDGVPMSDEAKAAMAAAMRIGLEEAKRRNKETYTPKKYKGE